jgi:hypothetical protein
VVWATGKRKRGGRREWAGLKGEGERESLFVYFIFVFKLKHHLNKLHLNLNQIKFGCYKILKNLAE